MTSDNKVTLTKHKKPALLLVSAIVILVMGIVGLVFFITATVYQYYNPQFLHDNIDIIDHYKHLNSYVIILAILHLGMIISALLILRLKKAGYYLFISIFLTMLASELLIDENLIINYLIPGIILILVIGIYYRRFSSNLS